MKKFLLIAGGAVLIAVVIVFLFSIGRLIHSGIETVGPMLTGVPIELEKVSFNPFNGKLRIQKMIIRNPEGFETDSVLNIGELHVRMSMRSLFTDTIILHDVDLHEPHVTYERTLHASNLSTLQKNLDALNTPAKNVIIENFRINGAHVSISAKLFHGHGVHLPLPHVHLKDVGKEHGGIHPVAAVKHAFHSIHDGVGHAMHEAGHFAEEAVHETGYIIKEEFSYLFHHHKYTPPEE